MKIWFKGKLWDTEDKATKVSYREMTEKYTINCNYIILDPEQEITI